MRRRMMLVTVVLWVTATALWSFVAVDIWAPLNSSLVADMRSLAVALTVMAWTTGLAMIVRDNDHRALIRLCGDLWDRIPETERPPLVQSVR